MLTHAMKLSILFGTAGLWQLFSIHPTKTLLIKHSKTTSVT